MKINIYHVAKLANLPLDEKHAKKLEKQLESILDYVNKLNDVNTSGIEETSQVTGLENVTRSDIQSQSISQKEALSGSKSTHNGFFKVPAILEE